MSLGAETVLSTTTTLSTGSAAKSLQSCSTLCNIDSSPPGSPVPGILRARTLEWVAISFSNAWKWRVKVKSLSHARLFATPWTAAHQAPLPMGFSRREHWSGVPLLYWNIKYYFFWEANTFEVSVWPLLHCLPFLLSPLPCPPRRLNTKATRMGPYSSLHLETPSLRTPCDKSVRSPQRNFSD